MPILVFLGLSVLELRPIYATDDRQTDVRRQTYVRQKHRLMPPPYGGGSIMKCQASGVKSSKATFNNLQRIGIKLKLRRRPHIVTAIDTLHPRILVGQYCSCPLRGEAVIGCFLESESVTLPATIRSAGTYCTCLVPHHTAAAVHFTRCDADALTTCADN